MTDTAGEVKRAENEAAFRNANEDIMAIIDSHEVELSRAPLVCECGDGGCRELISVPLDTYVHVRESPRRFFYAVDHIDRADEETSLVETYAGFVVVEKTGTAGAIADERWRDRTHA